MFKLRHYVPILKWKGAEHKALVNLDIGTKKHLTPLLQIMLPNPVKRSRAEAKRKREESKMSPEKQIELQDERIRKEKLKTPEDKKREEELRREEDRKEVISRCHEMLPIVAQDILDHWGSDYAILDLNLLVAQDLKIKGFKTILNDSNNLKTKLVPVLYLSDNPDLKRVVTSLSKKYSTGLCLRLVAADLININQLSKDLKKLLNTYQLNRRQIDIIIDMKDMDGNFLNHSAYFDLSQKIEGLKEWRTFIFACGAFPKNLNDCTIEEPNYISRDEWKAWNMKLKEKKAKRMPTFSDYVTQHPIFDPSSQFYHPTTSIKYTLDDDWLVLKGKRQKYSLYLVNAKLLEGKDEWFMGKKYSHGDNYIKERSEFYDAWQKDGVTKGRTGNSETWISASVNHHLVHTSNQVSNLS